ncbi:MAG: Gfo/Idh/MocA family oxidoreductase [Bacteroidales bacterium]|nr:Gfo/Idh/MocA family oxidoreductase [Bacteroidales bacterium]
MHRVSIIGGGETGESHIRSIQKRPYFELVGIHDFNQEERLRLQKKFQIPVFHSINELIDQSDIVDIASDATPHFDIAAQALRKSCHVFIDRPLISSLPEAQKLVELAFEANVKVQIGHMERFNPSFILGLEHIDHPNYIEARRMHAFEGNNQHVVLDMMIQDIDIILSITNSEIKKIQARAHSLNSEELLMVNANIIFDNGCIANLTSSKMAQEESCNMQIFQEHDSLNIDLTNNTVQQITFDPILGSKNTYLLHSNKKHNTLDLELESFHNSIVNNTTPNVSLMDGSKALEVAFMILDRVSYWQDVKLDTQKVRFGY